MNRAKVKRPERVRPFFNGLLRIRQAMIAALCRLFRQIPKKPQDPHSLTRYIAADNMAAVACRGICHTADLPDG